MQLCEQKVVEGPCWPSSIKQAFMSRNTSLPSLDFTLAVPSVRKFVRLFPEHQWVFFQSAPVSSTVPELTSS